MPDSQRFPDIEIYVRAAAPEALLDWLTAVVPEGRLEHAPHRDGHALSARWWPDPAAAPIEVLVVPGAIGRWASLWLQSDRSPWATDLDCAIAASRDLGVEVRCSRSGWIEVAGNEDEPGWWSVREGEPEPLDWDEPG